jgi:hypothetical protein
MRQLPFDELPDEPTRPGSERSKPGGDRNDHTEAMAEGEER